MAAALALHIDSNFFSPYALFAYVTLREKKLPFVLHTVDLASGAHQDPGYLTRSITAKVPMLEHGDFALTESTAIVEYLEDTFAASAHARVLPANAQQRARARQVLAWLNSDLSTLRTERPTSVIFQAPLATPLSAAGQNDADKLLAVAAALVPASGDCLFGDWCIADTALALMLNRLVANHEPVPEAARIYVEREWQRPAIQAWLTKDRG